MKETTTVHPYPRGGYKKKESIQVCLRMRPLLSIEDEVVWKVDSERNEILTSYPSKMGYGIALGSPRVGGNTTTASARGRSIPDSMLDYRFTYGRYLYLYLYLYPYIYIYIYG